MRSFIVTCVFALVLAVALGHHGEKHTTRENIYNRRSTTPEGERTTQEGIYGKRTSPLMEGSTTPTYGEGSPTPTYGEGSTTPTYGEGSTTPTYGEGSITPTYGESTTTSTYGESTTAPIYGERSTTPTYGESSTTPTYGESSTTPTYGESSTTPTYGESSTTPTYGESSTTPTYGESSTTPTYGESSTTPTYGESSTTPTYGESSTTPTYGERSTTPSSGERTTIPTYAKVTPPYLADKTCSSGTKKVIRCHVDQLQKLVKLSLVENFDNVKNSTADKDLKRVHGVSGIFDIFNEETYFTASKKSNYPILLRTKISEEMCKSPIMQYLRWETNNEDFVKLRIANKWTLYKNPSPSTPFTVVYQEKVSAEHFDIYLDKSESGKGGIGKMEFVVCCA